MSFKSRFLFPVLLFALIFAVYAPTFNAEFHFDDHAYILESNEILSISGSINRIGKHFFRPDRSLVTLSFALNHQVHKFELPGYHLVNISLHAMNGVLVFFLLSRLLFSNSYISSNPNNKYYETIAFGAALLFLLHPVAVNSVTYIAQRHGLLATFFYLLGFIAYINGRNANKASHIVWFFVCLLSFWGAIHSKPMALTFPFVLIVYEIIFRQRDAHALRKFAVVSFAFSVLSTVLIVVYAIQTGLFSQDAFLAGFRTQELWTPWQHMMTESVVFLHYWKILFLPLSSWLSGDHYFPVYKTLTSPVILSWLVHLCIVGIAVRTYLSKFKLICFGIVWFYITLVPPYLLLPIQDVKVDYKTYLASFGAVCILAECAFLFFKRYGTRPTVLVFLLLVTVSTVITVQRNQIFMTEESFWSDIIKKYPNESRPYNNRGLAYYDQGQFSKAILEFNKAISLQPNYGLVYANLGDSYQKTGDTLNALNSYKTYLQSHPNDANALVRIANIYARQKKWKSALEIYKKAVAVEPDNSLAMYNLALCHSHLNNYNQALESFHKVLNLDNRHSKALAGIGAIHYQQRNTKTAIQYFEQSIAIEPTSPDSLYNLAACYAKTGKLVEAKSTAKRLRDLDPKRGQVLLEKLELIK